MKQVDGPGLLALVAIAFWVYSGCLQNPFHFDDALFLQSAQVTNPENIWQTLSPGETRQLTYFTFALNYRLAGSNPGSYHMVNLLLHLANVAWVFFFCRLLLRREGAPSLDSKWRFLPLGSAAVFALHPVQSEVVNYAYQRSTLLAAFFSLASLCLYLRTHKAANVSLRWTCLVLLYILAVAGKESALALPLVILTHLWIFSEDRDSLVSKLYSRRGMLIVLVIFMLGGAGWILYVLHLKGDQTAGLAVEATTPFLYFVTQIPVIATYLRLLVWPAGLAVDHDYPPATLYSPQLWYSALLLALILYASLRLRRTHRLFSFLVLSFFLYLAPTSSFIPSADPIFEHRLYLPMIAGSILISGAAIRIASISLSNARSRAVASGTLLMILLTGYAAVSRQRTHLWGDNIRLWEDAAAKAPGKARVRYNLGVSYLYSDRDKARAEFAKALEIRPDHAPAMYNLGWLEQKEGRIDSALEYYRSAIASDPRHWQAHQNLGNLLLLKGSFQAAGEAFAETIRLKSEYWPAYQGLATAQIMNGEFKNALSTLTRLRQMHPDLLEPQYLMARALIGEGRFQEAARELKVLSSRDKEGLYKEHLSELHKELDRLMQASTPRSAP